MTHRATFIALFGSAMIVFGVLPAFAQGKVIAPDLTQIAAGKGWKLAGRKASIVEAEGRKGIRLDAGPGVGLAWLEDSEFTEGVIDVDLKGPFLCMRAAIPHMVAGGGGSVIAMGSTLGLIVTPGHPAYCAAKGALVNLCKQAAIEHAPDKVRVNVLAPSATDTGLFMKFSAMAPDPEALRAQIAATNPMGRIGTGDEVCDAVVFLASEHSRYISGAIVPLDGGLAARRIV